jgi:hypothetical protein
VFQYQESALQPSAAAAAAHVILSCSSQAPWCSCVDASPEAWADLVGVSPVEPLTQSPTPAVASLEDEGEEESTDQQQQEATAADTPTEAKQKPVQKQQQQQQEQASDDREQQQQQQQQQQESTTKAKQQPEQQPDSSSGSSDAALKEFSSSWMSRRQGRMSQAEAAADPSSAVSFLVLSDPKFPQVQQLLAGLDFAFPEANKVGS